MCLKCSHFFNLLDSRGAISVTERVKMIAQIRGLVSQIAEKYIARESSP
jgi:glycyl-tRNA synthetase alpha chain